MAESWNKDVAEKLSTGQGSALQIAGKDRDAFLYAKRKLGAVKLYERLEKLSAAAEVPWKQNALRHSFCSYRMATLKDAPRVSYEAGNSVRIIQRHYDKVVTESQGTTWFSITPETAANVIAFVRKTG